MDIIINSRKHYAKYWAVLTNFEKICEKFE